LILLKILTINNDEIKATPEHPFLIKENEDIIWKPVGELKPGDMIYTVYNNKCQLTEIAETINL
jgi:intein/homing endonuclease